MNRSLYVDLRLLFSNQNAFYFTGSNAVTGKDIRHELTGKFCLLMRIIYFSGFTIRSSDVMA
jgi:hypothetical protein